MSTYKNVSGDYVITVNNGAGNVVINGNLDIEGNITYIETTELEIQDPFIVLNVSNTPANLSSYYSNSGIITHKTSSTYAGLRYNRDTNQWEVSSDTGSTGTTGTWATIASGNVTTPPGGANTEVQFNNNGGFGGNANFTFDYSTSFLTLDGAMVLGWTTSSPSSIPSAATITSQALGGGGTGIYFTNNATSDELISKTQAIVYSLIF